jgi:hypothetical protein
MRLKEIQHNSQQRAFVLRLKALKVQGVGYGKKDILISGSLQPSKKCGGIYD